MADIKPNLELRKKQLHIRKLELELNIERMHLRKSELVEENLKIEENLKATATAIAELKKEIGE